MPSEFTPKEKIRAVLRLLQGEDAAAVSAALGVSPERLLRWQERFLEGGRKSLLKRHDQVAIKKERKSKLWQWVALGICLLIVVWVVTVMLGSHGAEAN